MGVSWEKPEARGGMGEREKSTCQAEKERHRIYVRNSKAAVTEVKRIKRNRVRDHIGEADRLSRSHIT